MSNYGDRDDWLLWHDQLGKRDGRLPTPDLDGLTVDEARDAWQAAVYGDVLPATGHDDEEPTAIRTGDKLHDLQPFRVVPPGTELILTTVTYTPTAYLVAGRSGFPMLTGDGDRLYVELT